MLSIVMQKSYKLKDKKMSKSIIRNDNDKGENQFEYFPPNRQADVLNQFVGIGYLHPDTLMVPTCRSP